MKSQRIRPIVWLALLVAQPIGAQSAPDAADRVLRAAAKTMGGPALVDAVQTLEAIADCQGPRQSYRTIMRSGRDGRIVFQQDFPDGRRYRAVVTAAGGSEYDSDSGKVTPASPFALTAAAGHAIHMLTLAPAALLGAPTGVTAAQFRGKPVIGVTFRNRMGGIVIANYDPSDTTLRGFTMPGPDGQPIALVIWRWRRFNGLLLPTRAVFWQGRDAYSFRFTSIRLNAVSDSAFAIAADAP